MRVNLSESHIKKVRFLLERNERYEKFMSKAEDIKNKVNRMYSKLIFTNFAEMIEGDYEAEYELQKLNALKVELMTYYDKFTNFINNLPDEELEKWSKIESESFEMEDEVSSKIDALEEILEFIVDNQDITDRFKDIKKYDI